jgi:brefeldin A-inhibited guanine nucleotide-exchange protein
MTNHDHDILINQFVNHLSTFYPLVTDILGKEVAPEMRLAVRDYLVKVGQVKGITHGA